VKSDAARRYADRRLLKTRIAPLPASSVTVTVLPDGVAVGSMLKDQMVASMPSTA
jgi:hypothetical protein